MAPLSPSNTPRFRVHYTTIAKNHTFQLRSHSSPAALGFFIGNFLATFGGAVAPITVDLVDWAPTGSDVFNPVSTGIEGGTYGAGTFTDEMAAWTYTWVGRTSGGRRSRISIFGAIFLGGNYRILPSESANLANALAVLNGNSANIVAIDDLPIVWHSYVDTNANDHWVKQART